MRILRLVAIGCLVGALGCGGDNGAATPPPGVDAGTTDVQIDMDQAQPATPEEANAGSGETQPGSATKPATQP